MTNTLLYPLIYLRAHRKAALSLSLIITTGILFLSLQPLAELPSVPGGDKTHHLIAYGLLAFPTALAIPSRLWVYGALYICLGGAIEIIQPYVNRYGEWLDFIANLSGVLIGTCAGLWCHHNLPNPDNK